MIEIHFHPLPGIDDGPQDWDEAVRLCQAAAADGTEIIVATPHVLRDPWLNEDRAARRALVAELNERLGGTPRVLPGCEYWFTTDAVELVEQALEGKGPLEFLGDTKLLLVEFPFRFSPKPALDAFHELRLLGVTPVIAHPERNDTLADDRALLAAFVERGAKLQVTAASFFPEFGAPELAATLAMYDAGLLHAVASDAHDPDHRPPMLSAAREQVRKHLGDEAAKTLFNGLGIGAAPAPAPR